MSIRVEWLDAEQSVIRYEFEGKWTWDDLQLAIKQVNAMLECVSHPVYMIIDVTRSSVIPSGALSQLRTGSSNAASNWGGGIFVGGNTLVKTLVGTFIKVYPRAGQRYGVAGTLEEALEIIRQKRNKTD